MKPKRFAAIASRVTGFQPYRGAAGYRERFFIAELDENHQVVKRLSAAFDTQIEGMAAWMRRQVRSARLVREITLVSVEV